MKDFVETIIEQIQRMDKIEELTHMESKINRISYPYYEISKIYTKFVEGIGNQSKYHIEIKYPHSSGTLELYKFDGSSKHIIRRLKIVFSGEENN